MGVELRAMTEDEFREWLPEAETGYAEDMARNAGLDPGAARDKARQDTEQLFPGGKPAAGQLVYAIEADRKRVGELWVAEREVDGRRVLWIWDVHVKKEHRGQGFGRAAMELAEREARRRGLGHVALNVFGGNSTARRLYRALGYVETAVAMRKTVS
jgi:ribosomal protein S18 acetylase RimI-like enzyme